MIQCYKPDNADYDHNGDITLFPTSCKLSCEINGTWELSMSHPLDSDGRWKHLSEEAVISAPTFQSDKQLFRVDKCIKTDSSVGVTAYPIFFDSADDCFLMDTRPTNQNGQNALNIMTQSSKYSGESDITTGGTAYFVRRNLMDAINGKDSPTFVQTWGGEILYDNFKIIVNERIGGDYGVEIRYGKNMDGLSYTVDMSNVVTRIIPVAYNGRTMSGNTPWVDSDNINKYAKKYIREVKFEDVKLAEDASDSEEEDIIICADQAALDAALAQKCEDMYAAGADLPAVTIQVNMIALEKTEQYKDFEDLVSVSLGDTVHCYNYRLGIITDARVIKMTWDCIRNQAGEMTLGDYEYNYFSELTSSLQAVSQIIGPGNTVVAERVAGVLNAINTQLRYQKNMAQKQDVRAILFEDTDPESPTYGAMCLGTQGFQIADSRTTDGKDWDWTTAFTAKGGYANTLIAGILSDKTGQNYWNLATGELVAGNATVQNNASGDSIRMRNAQMQLFRDGTEVGFIGTNNITGDENYQGLVFDLEDTGDYMSWAYKESPEDTAFTMIMTWARRAKLNLTAGMNFWGPINFHNGRLSNFLSSDGYTGATGKVSIITSIESQSGGGIKWWESSFTVRDGIVTSIPASSSEVSEKSIMSLSDDNGEGNELPRNPWIMHEITAEQLKGEAQ